MTKSDLVAALAASEGLTKVAATKIVDAVFSTITGALLADGEVHLAGFGTFAVKERAARKGHNPQTGAPVDIAAKRVVSFKAAKKLKDTANPVAAE
jgi:DNA-binding protein HU-beta